MREFVSYVLASFREATGWGRDNGYADLNVTARELLNFETPRGLRMTLSSLGTPQFATAYNLGTIGLVDGYLSYLYSSVPLTNVVPRSDTIPLQTLLRSYQPVQGARVPVLPGSPSESTPTSTITPTNTTAPPSPVFSFALPWLSTAPTTSSSHDIPTPTAADHLAYVAQEARALVDRPVLLYGRLYLPRSMLEAYMVKRLSTRVQLQLRGVSDGQLPGGGTVLGILQYDRGRYNMEGLASSDGGLLGFRGLYHFGAHKPPTEQHGQLSAGGEIYYGTLNKSGGVSVGARFATLPGHQGTPLTATLTVNPLMGNLCATYAVVAREYCSLATKFAFNVYSYESEWAVGMELWSKRRLAGLVAVDPGKAAATAATEDKPEKSLEKKASETNATTSTNTTTPKTRKQTQKAGQKEKTQDKTQEKEKEKETEKETETKTKTETENTKETKIQKTQKPPDTEFSRSFEAKLEWRLDKPSSSKKGRKNKKHTTPATTTTTPTDADKDGKDGKSKTSKDEYQGVLKARLDQNLKMGLMWEGRIQSLLFSLGTSVDLNKPDQPFRTLGLEIQFSS